MYNIFLGEKELNVKIGDKVSVQGNCGIVMDVRRGYHKEWNGKEYVPVEGSEYTDVKVNFTGELANWGQYQGGWYGGFVIED